MGIQRMILLVVAATSLAATGAYAQDDPSLGDLARQQRQQKEQSKTAPEKNAKPVKVITNEQIPAHPEMAAAVASHRIEPDSPGDSSDEEKISPGKWKSEIRSQENQIASLQREMDRLNESIRFAPANCAANCVGWNERQREKQQRVEAMQSQLQEQKRQLEEMQDAARKQGYGSSVYDP
jgi:hypothetical protein